MSGQAKQAETVLTIALDAPKESNNARERDLARRITAYLATEIVDTFSVFEIRERFGDGFTDPQIGRAIGAARETLRTEHRIEYVPSGAPYHYKRATAQQMLNRGRRFEDAATRKLRRAGRVFNAVDEAELSPDDRQRLQQCKDKNGHRVVQMQQLSRLRKPIPDGDDAQPSAAPRRGT